ncbi:MAG: flagellar hook-associated protein FlgK [Halobacteriovoraceae bacterium]|nr:flagellar hook-associated protein FlgK [Halobacteriovoraceae bacterium]
MSNLLEIGKSGLFASKKSLETTAHNLANTNTEGYSRQRAEMQNSRPLPKHGLILGTGVDVKQIKRIHDSNVEKGLNKALSKHHFFNERSSQLEKIEKAFNEIDVEGLHKVLGRFYNSFRQLANKPENEAIRSIVRENARLVIKDFRALRQQLDLAARSIDNRIMNGINEINEKIQLITELNVKIRILEAGNDESGDLRDLRDRAARKLSEYFKINYYHDNKGAFIVSAEGVGTLVTGGIGQKLKTVHKSQQESSNNMANSVEIYLENKPGYKITERFKDGNLSSLVNLRNKDIRNLQDNIDNTAYELIQTVNAVHRRGFVNRTIPIDDKKMPDLNDQKGPTFGVNFFKEPNRRYQAALDMDLSDAIKNDLSNMATALSPNKPGDNRVALAISKLQHEKVMENGTATIEENFLKNIGHIGLKAQKANFDKEHSKGILNQLNSIRERVSGVSIDEEAANMIKFQNAYEASAKVMSTADAMFKAILSIAP